MKQPYLGVMLDVSRHFPPVEDVLKLIGAVSLCGVNTLHWHLTDDQSWRIEIKKYPRLTDLGAQRGPSYFGAVSETELNTGFYTQEQLRQVVAYAGERGIQVIPAIEVPGFGEPASGGLPHSGLPAGL